jgi:hypothetical protein
MRVAVVADERAAALHGLDGTFAWGEGRTFAPGDGALAAWEPTTVFAFATALPEGPWRTIAWGTDVSAAPESWRRALRPAADALAALRPRRGAGVVVAGGDAAAREAALVKLEARRVESWAVADLTVADLERAAVVALLGGLDAAPAVLQAGRILVAPAADPGFGLLPWSDHLPYANEDEMVCSADVAQTFPEAFEPIVAMGALAARAHLASAVYGRLAVDAALEASAPA